ncbi:MAG: hypothetical protein DMF56_10430 [Acidobacteria bacterium]|nr:MAG: hypothetical protein DMF56_10430 [Acidobacteriota bacterium]
MRRGRVSLLIGLCCLLIYNANRRAIPAGDTYPARYLPFAILQNHTVLLDPVVIVAAQGRGNTAFWMVRLPNGHVISLYPVTLPVLIAPLYLPAVGYLHLRGWSDPRLDHVAKVMEKLSASLIAALSAALLYLLLRKRTTGPVALLLTIAYAFGTTTWVISSQALWQHGIAQFLVIGALLLVTGPCTAPRALAVGLLCGLIAANRPPDVILAAALGAYALFWAGRRRAALLAAGAALPAGLVLFYNLGVAGNLAGGYGVQGRPEFFHHDLLSGIGGLLVSPTRGLLVFSPFLVFLVLAWRHLPRDRRQRALTMAMMIAVVLQILLYAKADWRAGVSWGPRYMTDLLPFLMWMLVPVVSALRGAGRLLFLSAVGVAILIQAIGAFCYTGMTDWVFFTDSGMRAMWNWRNAPFLASLKQGLAPAESLAGTRGSLDAIDVTTRQEAIASGWALIGHATPARVSLIIDGRQTVTTKIFFDRPDVRDALHEASPAGWRIPFSTAGLAPGDHYVTAFARTNAKGEGRYLYERRFSLENLEASSRSAASRIREHQQAPGYWLTAYTSGTSFHDPHPEMNTFLTALLVELLDPLASANGLTDSLQRARRHLTKQIEPGGLVRFHGLPDAPGIGTLGCAITPDTDDTTLVWRLAPGADRTQLTAALATIDRYRTPEGLYRTWLAPREAYQCLDPGRDPNPTDIAIQMHLLLLLSDVRPEAGRALCEALRPVVDQDRVWVYYRKAPLIPILRLPDLRRAGCDLKLPESRMHTDVSGQQIWVDVVRLLLSGREEIPRHPESAKRDEGSQNTKSLQFRDPSPSARLRMTGIFSQPLSGTSAPDAERIHEILRDLAANDFFLLRTSPPLLYHNDLTASVSRYYWSEDAGYALWLRLYHEYEFIGSPDSGH